MPALIWPPISKAVGENVERVFVRFAADFLKACNFESRGSQVYANRIPTRGRFALVSGVLRLFKA